MTAGELQRGAEPSEHALSADEADRLAAAIRPSWEHEEEGAFRAAAEAKAEAARAGRTAVQAARSPEAQPPSPAAAVPPPQAPSAGSTSAPDTVIEGIPTIAVTGDESSVASEGRASAVPSAEPRGTRSRRPIASGVASNGEPQPQHAPADAPPAGFVAADRDAPAPAGKTRLGLSERDEPIAPAVERATPAAATASARADSAPPPAAGRADSVPAPAARRADSAPPPRSKRTSSGDASRTSAGSAAAPAHAARTDDNDPIELPVSGPNKAALRVVIALVGVAFLFFVGRAILSSSQSEPQTAPTATAAPAAIDPPREDHAAPAPAPEAPVAADATAAKAAPEPPAAAPSLPAEAPTTAAAPSAKAPASAAAARPAPPAATSAVTRPTQPPPPAVVRPVAVPPAAGTSPPGSKKGGGIIRDAPF